MPALVLGALAALVLVVLAIPALRKAARWWLPGFKEAHLSRLASSLSLLLKAASIWRRAGPDAPIGNRRTYWPRSGFVGTRAFRGRRQIGRLGQKNASHTAIVFLAGGWRRRGLAAGFARAAEIYYARAAYKAELLLNSALPVSVVALGLIIVIQIFSTARVITAEDIRPFQLVMKLFWPSLFWLLLWFAPLFIFSFGLYWLFTLPLRRQERARFLLDLLETGFRQGQLPEATIAAIAATQDRSVGVRFHLLAAHVQSGLAFTDALARVPSLASPQVAALLRVGEKLGDVRKVFPVCRGMLRDANSQMRNAVNYLMLLALVGTPIVPLLLATVRNAVMPKFREVAEAYGVNTRPTGMMGVINLSDWIMAAQIIMAVLICLGVAVYIGGPRLRRWIATILPTLCDRLCIACRGAASGCAATSPRCWRCCWTRACRSRHQFSSQPRPQPTKSFWSRPKRPCATWNPA
jgi:hypothetical protein